MLYFAYGSNLNRAHFQALCPAAAVIGRASLSDYRLVFRTFADIEPWPEGEVQGALWRVTRNCETALDRYEEIASGLYTRHVVEVSGTGGAVSAFTYRMCRRNPAEPTAPYLKLIEDGYRDFGLDVAALFSAIGLGKDQETPGQYATRPDA